MLFTQPTPVPGSLRPWAVASDGLGARAPELGTIFLNLWIGALGTAPRVHLQTPADRTVPGWFSVRRPGRFPGWAEEGSRDSPSFAFQQGAPCRSWLVFGTGA